MKSFRAAMIRLSKFRNSKGSVTVLMFFVLPFLVVALLFLVDTGKILVTRARLSIAADRAAYAGAAFLAHALNEIAAANRRIYDAWGSMHEDFLVNTEQNEDAANERFARYEAERDDALDEIEKVIADWDVRAKFILNATLKKNAPEANAEIFAGPEPEISSELDPENQWGEAGYSFVTGENFADPEDTDGGSFYALRFLEKVRAASSFVTLSATQEISGLSLEKIFGGKILIQTSSAAKAFGGSIKDHALGLTEGDYDALYRAAQISIEEVR